MTCMSQSPLRSTRRQVGRMQAPSSCSWSGTRQCPGAVLQGLSSQLDALLEGGGPTFQVALLTLARGQGPCTCFA